MWFAKWFGGAYDDGHEDRPSRRRSQRPPQKPVPPSAVRHTASASKDAKLKGFDPYNSGAFETRNAWEKSASRSPTSAAVRPKVADRLGGPHRCDGSGLIFTVKSLHLPRPFGGFPHGRGSPRPVQRLCPRPQPHRGLSQPAPSHALSIADRLAPDTGQHGEQGTAAQQRQEIPRRMLRIRPCRTRKITSTPHRPNVMAAAEPNTIALSTASGRISWLPAGSPDGAVGIRPRTWRT